MSLTAWPCECYRTETVSWCGRSHFHGSRIFCSRTGNGGHWSVLCERWHRYQWSDWVSCLQHHVCYFGVRPVRWYRVPSQLVATYKRLFLLCTVHPSYALHHLQWNDIMVCGSLLSVVNFLIPLLNTGHSHTMEGTWCGHICYHGNLKSETVGKLFYRILVALALHIM